MTWLLAFLVLFAAVGCSANNVPAERAGSAPPAPPLAASEAHAVVPAPTATESPAPSTEQSRRSEHRRELVEGTGPTVIATVGQTTAPDAPPADAQGTSEEGRVTAYRVQAGDTLWGIAIVHGVSLETLLAANGLEDPDTIWVGQGLVIPGAQNATVEVRRMSPQTTPTPVDHSVEDFPKPSRIREHSTPAKRLPPLPTQALLEPMLHDWQKMNNCAPTTVAMALSYYDRILTQFDTAPALKGGPQDKNVSPAEIVAYLHDQGFGGIVRVNGDIEILQRLVSNGIPVIVEQWLDRPDDELTGHYRLVRGYDQTTQEMIVNDSYSGPRLHFSYAEFDRLWRPFNRAYIPVYQPEREPAVRAIIGDDWDDGRMYERAIKTAQIEINTVGDAYAWFNGGNSLLGLGDYERAAEAFDRAVDVGLPPRMFWYQFGAFEAYNQTGQFQRVIELSAPLTGLALEELHFQRGVAYEGLGQRAAALAEYQRAAELNPRLTKASDAIARLI